MDMELLQQILIAALKTGTPLLLIALGELVCEKSGVLNLGQEGMMLMGAMAGFAGAYYTGSLGMGIAIAIFAGMSMSLIFATLSVSLNTNQVATGLALTIFGTGLSSFLGGELVGFTIQGFAQIEIPLLSRIPFIGQILFNQDIIVYASFAIVGLTWYVLQKTRIGLTLRAVGENPHSANALGIKVLKVRYLAVLFGGAMAGFFWCLYVSRLHTNVDGKHDRGPRVDCPCIGCFCFMASRLFDVGRLSIWLRFYIAPRHARVWF